VKPEFPVYNPPERPKSIYYKGAEFFYNAATGVNRQYYNYRCRDYLCHASLRFRVEDIHKEPKILKGHKPFCRELTQEGPGIASLRAQAKYNQVVAQEFARVKGTYESGLSIYQRMLALARDFAKAELAHIYPPHKKQFIRGIREVRRAARGYANKKSFDLNWEITFANLLFRC